MLSVAVFGLGCVLIALGLVMMATKAGYVYFVVGPRTVLALAAFVGIATLAVKVFVG